LDLLEAHIELRNHNGHNGDDGFAIEQTVFALVGQYIDTRFLCSAASAVHLDIGDEMVNLECSSENNTVRTTNTTSAMTLSGLHWCGVTPAPTIRIGG
jgi:hypothetical protein